MNLDASPFIGNTALYAVIAVAVLLAILAVLGRTGKVRLPFFEASTTSPKKVVVANNLHVTKDGEAGNILGTKTKGEGAQDVVVANRAVIEGKTGDITGSIED